MGRYEERRDPSDPLHVQRGFGGAWGWYEMEAYDAAREREADRRARFTPITRRQAQLQAEWMADRLQTTVEAYRAAQELPRAARIAWYNDRLEAMGAERDYDPLLPPEWHRWEPTWRKGEGPENVAYWDEMAEREKPFWERKDWPPTPDACEAGRGKGES